MGQLSLPKQCSNRIPNSLSAQAGASAPLQSVPTRSLCNLSHDGCSGHQRRGMPLRLALYVWIYSYPLRSQPHRTCPSPSLPIQRSSWEATRAEATPRQRSPSPRCGAWAKQLQQQQQRSSGRCEHKKQENMLNRNHATLDDLLLHLRICTCANMYTCPRDMCT